MANQLKGAWHIRAGTRTELDKQVREIMKDIPEGKQSEFIKTCIVKATQTETQINHQSELEKFKAEIRTEIQRLEQRLAAGAIEGAPTQELETDHDALHEAKKKLEALEEDW